MKLNSLFAIPALVASSAIAQDMSAILEHPGLEIWRQPDHVGMSCMNCHGPLPVDIAAMNVPKDHLFVRDIFHVNEEESALLADFIDTVQEQLPNLVQVDRFNFRPLQPGGEVLAEGESIAARDRAFFEYLKEEKILLASGELKSHRDAMNSMDQILGINLFDLKVGLEFPKISSDFHFGTDHESLNEWIPLHAVKPKTEADVAQWHALQDAYIANPSDENFWDMYLFAFNFQKGGNLSTAPFVNGEATLATLTDEREISQFKNGMGKAKRFIKNQYGSMLVLQHILLREALGQSRDSFIGNGGVGLMATADVARYNNYHPRGSHVPNPFWEVGHGSGKDSAPSWLYKNEPAFRVNMGDLPNGKVGRDIREDEIGAPWFWIGWMFDNGVRRINKSNSTKNMEYFQATYRFSYDAHMLFAGFTKNIFLHRLADTAPKAETYSMRLPSLNAVHFLPKSYAGYLKSDPEYAGEYLQMIMNGYTTHLGVIKDSLRIEPHMTYSTKTMDNGITRIRDHLSAVNRVNNDLDMVTINRKLERLKRLNAELIAAK